MNAVSFVARHVYDFETKVWPIAHERGIALVAMKVYGGRAQRGAAAKGGRITGDAALQAFRYAQSLPHVSTVVVGPADKQELLTNIEWSRTYKPLSNNEMKTLLARGKPLAEEWGEFHGPVA